jgi:MoaA/NifB/PqqE/SkfB family radical SAM enzyme
VDRYVDRLDHPAPSRASQGRRLHINTGAFCNNNCLFCMEGDRDGRFLADNSIRAAEVRTILEHNRDAEEVCFTSGEPTTNPELVQLVRWARELGYARISIMTNGRMLSHVPAARRLVDAGMSRFYISIHGHEAQLHDGLTRTPDSFAQTVRGIVVVKALARQSAHPVDLHTCTVVNKRNLPWLPHLYRFLRERGVDQVVFNAMEVNGRALAYFDQLVPRYTDVAAGFLRLIQQAGETQVMAFLVDVPPCLTRAIPDFHRGFVEQSTHFSPKFEIDRLGMQEHQAASSELFAVERADIDRAQRSWHARCSHCRHRPQCNGVWNNYVEKFGWDEFEPV